MTFFSAIIMESMSAEVDSLKKQVADSSARVAELEKEKENSQDANSVRAEVVRLTRENGDLLLHVKSLEQDVAQASAAPAAGADDFTTKMVIDSLTSEVEEAKRTAAKRDAEVAELKASVEELSALLESGGDGGGETDELKKRIEDLEKQNATLTADLAKSKAAPVAPVSPVSGEAESLQDKLARLKSERVSSVAAVPVESPAEKLARLKAEREAVAAPTTPVTSAATGAVESPAEKLARLKASMKK